MPERKSKRKATKKKGQARKQQPRSRNRHVKETESNPVPDWIRINQERMELAMRENLKNPNWLPIWPASDDELERMPEAMRARYALANALRSMSFSMPPVDVSSEPENILNDIMEFDES